VAVGAWYDYFPQLTDEEVVDLLETAKTPSVQKTEQRV
jgi:predicted phosphoribosyltransferase